LLQFFDDVISDGIEWGKIKQKQICHRNSRGKKSKHSYLKKYLSQKKARDMKGRRAGKNAGILLLC